MSLNRYMKHPIIPTELSFTCLRARLSVKETQRQFAKRFMVQTCTINNWETGKSKFINKVHREILIALCNKLFKEGTYVDAAVVDKVMQERIAKRGNGAI